MANKKGFNIESFRGGDVRAARQFTDLSRWNDITSQWVQDKITAYNALKKEQPAIMPIWLLNPDMPQPTDTVQKLGNSYSTVEYAKSSPYYFLNFNSSETPQNIESEITQAISDNNINMNVGYMSEQEMHDIIRQNSAEYIPYANNKSSGSTSLLFENKDKIIFVITVIILLFVIFRK